MNEDQLTACAKIRAIAEAEGFAVLIWTPEDVLSVRPDLLEEQAQQVLGAVERHHDATLGVTWDTLSYEASMMYPKKKEA